MFAAAVHLCLYHFAKTKNTETNPPCICAYITLQRQKTRKQTRRASVLISLCKDKKHGNKPAVHLCLYHFAKTKNTETNPPCICAYITLQRQKTRKQTRRASVLISLCKDKKHGNKPAVHLCLYHFAKTKKKKKKKRKQTEKTITKQTEKKLRRRRRRRRKCTLRSSLVA